MSLRRIALTGIAVVVGGAAVFTATPLGRDLLFHILPIGWTGEVERLAKVLEVGPGKAVADIGAGSGSFIIELSRLVGPGGRALATERTPDQRQRIVARAAAAGVHVTVLEAAERSTNLPDACCDAIVMRMVMHHLVDAGAFARDLGRTVRSGGRVGIIDFAPGALPHLGSDHGVDPDRVVAHFTAAGFEPDSRDDHWGGRTYLIVFRAP